MDSLKLSARKLQYGAGIYEAGDTEKCYTKLFVTESGRVLPTNRRVLTEDDLLEVYSWGFEDGKACGPEGEEQVEDPRLPTWDEFEVNGGQ